MVDLTQVCQKSHSILNHRGAESDMTWECKYQTNGNCEKRKTRCLPGEEGCVLQGKFKFVQTQTDIEEKEHYPEKNLAKQRKHPA